MIKRRSFMVAIVCFLYGLMCHAQFKKIYDCSSNSAGNPQGTMLFMNNKLYGMEGGGGKDSAGVIFRIDTNGSGYTKLHDFNHTDGASPAFSSLAVSGNKFFGVTSNGGIKNDGVIFSMDTNGNGYKILYNFDSVNGKYPTGQLAVLGNKLFGTTYEGGVGNQGVIFSIDTNGISYNVILYFNGSNGSAPDASIMILGNSLYGTATGGGKYSQGNIFSIDTNGSGFTSLHDFGDTSIDGGLPFGMMVVSNSTLYGMTNGGGGSGGSGVVFAIHTNGSGYHILHTFSTYCNGQEPYASFAISGNTLYGVTQGGLYGTIFSIDTNATNYKCLHSFGDTDGARPVYCGLTLWGGMIYGVTESGGLNNAGVIFSYKDSAVTTAVNQLSVGSVQLSVYPNPGNGVFTAVINSYQLGITNQIDVYNILGEKVCSTFNIQNSTFTIDISGQPAGIYLYRVTSEKGELVGSGKLVIE